MIEAMNTAAVMSFRLRTAPAPQINHATIRDQEIPITNHTQTRTTYRAVRVMSSQIGIVTMAAVSQGRRDGAIDRQYRVRENLRVNAETRQKRKKAAPESRPSFQKQLACAFNEGLYSPNMNCRTALSS